MSNLDDPLKAHQAEIGFWKQFKSIYETHKQKKDTCALCAKEYVKTSINDFRNQFNLQASEKDLKEAFKQDSYEKFLDRLLVPDECWDNKNLMGLKDGWAVNYFPKEEDTEKSYSVYINKIKEILKKKRPMSVSYCAQDPLTVSSHKECSSLIEKGISSGKGHGVIIKGYRKMCNTKNICRESLQVQNSWGQSWQINNNDGWIDAKEILDRTFYDEGITWLEKK